jgi:hypothetical protein
MSEERSFPIRLIGTRARDVLAGDGDLRVFAVFRRSFYLADGDDRLACVGGGDLGTGPLNALCDQPEKWNWQTAAMSTDSSVERSENALWIGGKFSFPLDQIEDWRPPYPGAGWRTEDLSVGLALLARTACGGAPAEGLGRLVPLLAMGTPGAVSDVAGDDPLIRLAATGIAALGRWIADDPSDPQILPEAARILIGLGPGLTPSGDDFIGGALIALRALGTRESAKRLAAWVLPLARERTGLVSFAHLACAADGEGAAALHEALVALCRPEKGAIKECLRAIDTLGHSSGWDALAGLSMACAAIARSRRHLGEPCFEESL